MNPQQVEDICLHLSTLLKNTIRNRFPQREEAPTKYTLGEALLFWLADWLIGMKLLKPEQLLVLLEEIYTYIGVYGRLLEIEFNKGTDVKLLPVCNIGFLDRHFVCLDTMPHFFDLITGNKTEKIELMPLETIVYSLTVLSIRYQARLDKQTRKVD